MKGDFSTAVWLSSFSSRCNLIIRGLKKRRLFQRRLTFSRLHICYFLLLDAVGALIIWLSPKPSDSISFVDSLYSSTSALTVTGLTCLRMHQFAFSDKLVLMFLMILGSQWFTSLLPLVVRRSIFHTYLSHAVKEFNPRKSFVNPISLAVDITDTPHRWNYWTDGVLKAWLNSRGDDSSRVSLRNPSFENAILNPLETVGSQHSRRISHASPLHSLREDVAPEIGATQLKGESEIKESLSRGHLNTVLNPVETEKRAQVFPGTVMNLSGNANHYDPSVRMFSANSDGNERDTCDSHHVATKEQHQSSEVSKISELETQFTEGSIKSDEERNLPSSSSFSSEPQTRVEQVTEIPPAKFRMLLKKACTFLLQRLSVRRNSLAYPFPSLSRFESNVAEPPMLNLDELSLESDALEIIPILEYKSLSMLSWVVLSYGLFSVFIGFVFLRISLLWSQSGREAISSNDLNSTFFSFFLSVSAFCNGGWTLLETNLLPFQENSLFLCTMCILILMGNTMLAPCLRIFLRFLHTHYPQSWRNRVALKYLLDEPRKCFTHLFPRNTTLWLLFTVLSLNSLELLFFLILDWKSPSLEQLSAFSKIIAGLSQSVCTRTAGFNVIEFASLSPAMFILYSALMYVAVYPVYLSRQKTKVKRTMEDYDPSRFRRKKSQLKLLDSEIFFQGRAMVAQDSALLFFVICLISIMEDKNIRTDENFGLFHIIFEVLSAYGNVGLSFGYHCDGNSSSSSCHDFSPPLSLSGVWKWNAKLVLVLVMLAGRQRGLPDDVDSAILIPNTKFFDSNSTRSSAGSKHDFGDGNGDIF